MDKVTCRAHTKLVDSYDFSSSPQKGGRCDLHMHTVHSDGVFTSDEIIRTAKRKGLTAIAITDHDTINGIAEAQKLGASLDVEVISGIELSAMYGPHEIHILGYFIDHRDTNLLEYLSFFREQRVKRAREMVRRLNDLKIPVDIDSILDSAPESAIGRPHIAAAVVETGYAKSYFEVFKKFIGAGCPAYVAKHHLDVGDAIRLIARAGGLSFIAHPTDAVRGNTLLHIIKAGIDGIETVHPSLSKEKTDYYRSLAREYSLLESGGSDFHGGNRNDEAHIGLYTIPIEYLDAMRKRLIA